MRKNLHLKVLAGALAVALTGAVGVLAQNQTRENAAPVQAERQATEPNNDRHQMCPMMGEGRGSQMNMSMMMDCCKKMGMNTERPAAAGNAGSERRQGSDQ